MKNLNRNIGALLTLAVFLVTAFAFADHGSAAVAGSQALGSAPEWLTPVLDFIVALPVVGPVLLVVLKYVGIVTALLTALTTFVHAIATALAGVAQAAGLNTLAQKLLSFRDKVYPYLAYLSAYNVQKQGPAAPAPTISPLSKS